MRSTIFHDATRAAAASRAGFRPRALACLAACTCITGNVRDARKSDVITDTGTRIGWKETEPPPFELVPECSSRSWSVTLCAAGAWERRWPVVSFEAATEGAATLSAEITPGHPDGRYANTVSLEAGTTPTTRQIFGEDDDGGDDSCALYGVTFSATPPAEVSVDWFVVGFVEGGHEGEVDSLEVSTGGDCP